MEEIQEDSSSTVDDSDQDSISFEDQITEMRSLLPKIKTPNPKKIMVPIAEEMMNRPDSGPLKLVYKKAHSVFRQVKFEDRFLYTNI